MTIERTGYFARFTIPRNTFQELCRRKVSRTQDDITVEFDRTWGTKDWWLISAIYLTVKQPYFFGMLNKSVKYVIADAIRRDDLEVFYAQAGFEDLLPEVERIVKMAIAKMMEEITDEEKARRERREQKLREAREIATEYLNDR